MKDLIEIRWHGRGGQGAVTAARLLAEVAVTKDYYAQAFPEFGPERRGAPVQAFTRISSAPIRAYYGIAKPNAVIVLDSRIYEVVDVTYGIVSEGVVLINTRLNPNDIKKKLSLVNAKVATVDASGIALDCIRLAIPNTAMIGAFVRLTNLLSLDDVQDCFKEIYTNKFSEEALQGNLEAIRRAYEEVVFS